MVNWSIAQQPGAFERSFQSGLQMGEFVRQRREQTQERNALADYARNPGEQSLNALANFRPDIVIQERERVQAAQAQQQERATAGINEFRPVLQQAMQSPEAWSMARTALAQAGHDISDVPDQYDPQWAQGQLMILNAAEDGSLPTIARELQVAGIDIETPEGQQVLRQVIEGRYATEYVDPEGNTRRQSLFNLPPVGQQAQAPQSPQAAPMQAPQGQGPGAVIAAQDFARHVASMGPEVAARFTVDNNIAVRVATPDEARRLPSGTLILLPDGSEGRVP